MTYLRPAILGCWLLGVLAPASASAEGWKFPNLNPFKRDKSPAARRSVSDDKGMQLPKLSMPKMEMPKMKMPKAPDMGIWPASQKKRGPSTWNRMSNGAKSMFSKTKNTLMPWSKPESKSADRSSYRTARSTADEKKGGFFPSWFSDRQEEKPIRTPEEFLQQPRVLPSY